MATTSELDYDLEHKGKALLLTLYLYTSPTKFVDAGSRWFPELKEQDNILEDASARRRDFWRRVAIIIATDAIVISLAYLVEYLIDGALWDLSFKEIALAIGVTAMASIPIQRVFTYSGGTLLERIDRGFYTFLIFVYGGLLFASIFLP